MITAVIHRTGSEVILAACDSDIHGKKFEDNDIVLDLGGPYFSGSEVTEDEFRGMLAMATSGTLVGPRTVAIAIECGCIHGDAVADLAGVPHALFFCMG